MVLLLHVICADISSGRTNLAYHLLFWLALDALRAHDRLKSWKVILHVINFNRHHVIFFLCQQLYVYSCSRVQIYCMWILHCIEIHFNTFSLEIKFTLLNYLFPTVFFSFFLSILFEFQLKLLKLFRWALFASCFGEI